MHKQEGPAWRKHTARGEGSPACAKPRRPCWPVGRSVCFWPRTPILQLCRQSGIPVDREFTMARLGRACRIEVGCAAAAELKNP